MTDLRLTSLRAGCRSAHNSFELHRRDCHDCDWGYRKFNSAQCCENGFRLWQDWTKAGQAVRDYERELAAQTSDQLSLW